MTNEPTSTNDADELQRLREENESLRSQLATGKSASSGRGRSTIAILLVVVGSLLLPVAVATSWVRTQVFSTSDYVDMVAPLAEDPAIQQALANRIAEYVQTEVDIESEVEALLPTEAQALAPIIASGAVEATRTIAGEFVKTNAFATLWRNANELGHAVALEVLTGRDEGAIQVQNGQIYIPIGEMITEVAEQAGEQFGVDLASQLPEDVADARYVVAESDALADAQDLLETIDRLAWFTVILALVCLIAAIFVAPSRSRGVLWTGIGIVTAMVVTRLGLAWGRNLFRDGLEDAGGDPNAALAFFDIITRFLTQSIRVVFVVGLILLIAGWLSGPGVRAARTRDWFNQVTGRASERFDEPSEFARWVAAQRSVLRVIVIALAVIVLFAWERPTALVVILIAIVTGLLLWLIALFARVGDESEGSPSTGSSTEVEASTDDAVETVAAGTTSAGTTDNSTSD